MNADTLAAISPVHNHGPEDGPGIACRERLVGQCLLDAEAARHREAVAALRSTVTLLHSAVHSPVITFEACDAASCSLARRVLQEAP